MKKYKLEIAIGAVFFGFLTAFLWNTLAEVWKGLPWIMVGVVVIGLAASIIPWPASKGTPGSGKSYSEKYAPRFFAQTIVASIVGIALIVVVAALLNRPRFSTTFDLTERKINSLSSETIKFLESLQEEVTIYCVPSPNPVEDYCADNQRLQSLYAERSDKLKLQKLSPETPELLQRVRPQGYSRLVVEFNDRRSEVIGSITESKLTNAIIGLVKNKKTVYVLAGSGEPGLAGGERSYASLVEVLRNRSYEVKEHTLAQGDLPDDAELVIAGGNTVPYSAATENSLRKILARGGKLILNINPYRPHGLEKLLQDLDLKVTDRVLVNNGGVTQVGAQLAQISPLRPPILIGDLSTESPITNVFPENQALVVEAAREIETVSNETDDTVDTKSVRLLSAFHSAPVQVSEGESMSIPLEGPTNLKPASGFDAAKTYPVAFHVTVENPKNLGAGSAAAPEVAGQKPRAAEVVVFGFEVAGPFERVTPVNGQILPVAVSALYKDTELVSIPSRDMAPRQFRFDRSPGAFLILFSGFLPVATALAGFYIWMRRRSA